MLRLFGLEGYFYQPEIFHSQCNVTQGSISNNAIFYIYMLFLFCRGSLLKTIWSPTPTKRPSASEIVELLTNNPRLISPCIDVPLASVQIERTDSLELLPMSKKSPTHATIVPCHSPGVSALTPWCLHGHLMVSDRLSMRPY